MKRQDAKSAKILRFWVGWNGARGSRRNCGGGEVFWFSVFRVGGVIWLARGDCYDFADLAAVGGP